MYQQTSDFLHVICYPYTFITKQLIVFVYQPISNYLTAVNKKSIESIPKSSKLAFLELKAISDNKTNINLFIYFQVSVKPNKTENHKSQ